MRARRVLVVLAAAGFAVGAAGWAAAAAGLPDVTFAGCLAGGKLSQVQVTRTPSCAASATPVQWAGQAAVSASPAPSPSLSTSSPPSPSPVPSPSPSPSPSPAPSASPGFVTASGQQLLLNGNPYRMIGVNLWRANVSFQLPNTGYLVNQGTTLADSLTAIQAGCPRCNVIRGWFFQQEVTPTTAGYDWAPFDKTLQVAAAAGFKVIAVLADEWAYEGPPQKTYDWYAGGYQTVVDRGTANGVAYNENVPYLTYVQDFAARYASNTTIAAIELVNEAQDANADGSCPAGAGQVMRAFADTAGGAVRAADPNHLISLGTAGNGQCGTIEGDYQTVMGSPDIDLCSFHGYYGYSDLGMTNAYNGLNVRVTQCAALGKPVYIGESGLHAGVSPCNGDLSCRGSNFSTQMGDVFAGQGVTGFMPWQWDSRGISATGDDYVIAGGDPVLPVLDSYALP